MKKTFILFLFCSLSLNLLAQYSIKQRFEFAHHLIKSNDFDEALIELNYLDNKTSSDSLFYFKGWSLYSLKQLTYSAENFRQVSEGSTFYHKSHFFAAYNYTHTSNYSEAKNTLNQIKINDKLDQLKSFELSGIALLQREFDTYEASRIKSKNILPALQTDIRGTSKVPMIESD